MSRARWWWWFAAAAWLGAGCQSGYAPTGEAGEPCQTDSACASGRVCVAFVCVDAREAEPAPLPSPSDAGGLDAGSGHGEGDGGGEVYCTPGALSCLDATTRLRCFEGVPEPQPVPCAAGEQCRAGACIPADAACVEGEGRCGVATSALERCVEGAWVPEQTCEGGCQLYPARCAGPAGVSNLRMRSVGGEAGSFRASSPYRVSLQADNTGDAAVETLVTCDVVMSADAVYDARDERLLSLGALLAPGEVLSREEVAVVLPPRAAPGSYHILGVCDPLQRLDERDEDDNVVTAGPVLEIVAGERPALPELTLSNLEVTGDRQVSPIYNGEGLFVGLTVRNLGEAPAPPAVIAVWLSRDPTLEESEDILVQLGQSPALGPREIAPWSLEELVLVALEPGLYYPLVVIDPGQEVDEAREDNNLILGAPILIDGPIEPPCPVDALEPNNADAPQRVEAGVYEDLWTCWRAVDYYTLCPPAGAEVTIRVTRLTPEIALGLSVTSSRGASWTSSDVYESPLEFSEVSSGGCYEIEVRESPIPRNTRYRMEVRVE